MAIYTKLTRTQITRLLKNFPDLPKNKFRFSGIGMGTVNTYYKISFSKNEIYYLKIDEVGDESRLKNEIAVFKTLAAQRHKLSFEFPFPLRAKNKKYYIPFVHKFALVFPEVHGKAIFNGLNKNHLFAIGTKIAELHRIKIGSGVRPHRFALEGLKDAFRQMNPILRKKHPVIYNFLSEELQYSSLHYPKNSKSTLIHADLFPENIHWLNNKFHGMIDFEAAGVGPPLFDLCVAFHALCHNGQKFNYSKVKALLKGYCSVRPFKQRDITNVEFFMNLTGLRFLITRLKDFELPGADPAAENFKDYREYVRRFGEIEEFAKKLWV